MPSLLKEWIDTVFEHGWAYGHDGKALQGKDLLLAATTGGGAESYSESGDHRRVFSDFLPPYEQTARLCGMRWLELFIVHGARHMEEADITGQASRYRALLESYPAWTGGMKPDAAFS
jgi:glutathione-regulated potassium-efflux system ancillary protein KefF